MLVYAIMTSLFGFHLFFILLMSVATQVVFSETLKWAPQSAEHKTTGLLSG